MKHSCAKYFSLHHNAQVFALKTTQAGEGDGRNKFQVFC
jgi:hypothetical protein